MKKVSWTIGRIVWLLCTIFTLFVFFVQLHRGLLLEFNLLELLPVREKIPRQVISSFMEGVSQELVILVENPRPELSRDAAKLLGMRLEKEEIFSQIIVQNRSFDSGSLEQFFFPYKEGLYGQDVQSLLEGPSPEKALIDRVQRVLSTPFMGSTSSSFSKDPLLLFTSFIRSLPPPPPGIHVEEGFVIVDETKAVLLRASLRGNVFSRKVQLEATQALRRSEGHVSSLFPGTKVSFFGALLFADAMASKADRDVSLVSIGSLVGTVLLLWIVFRGLLPILASMITVGVGLLFAVTWSGFVFPKLHILTLGFGATLIGVCADYSFHFLCHRGMHLEGSQDDTLRKVLPGLTFGMLTSILGYFGLFLTPFPGLNQMAFFAITGMVAAYLSVVLLLPLLRIPVRDLKGSFLHRWVKGWLSFSGQASVYQVGRWCAPLLLVLLGVGIWQCTIQDDVRLLQTVPPELQQKTSQFQQQIGNFDTGQAFIVSAENAEKLLEKEERLTSLLAPLRSEGKLASYEATSVFVPSKKTQMERTRRLNLLLQRSRSELRDYMETLGFSRASQEELFSRASEQRPVLSLEEWLHTSLSEPFRRLWIGEKDGTLFSVVTLRGVKEPALLWRLETQIPGLHFVDQARDATQLLKEYRIEATKLVALCYIGIFLFLSYRYGLKRAILGILPAILSVVVTFAFLGYLSLPVTLFTLIAQLIVLGLAIDYAVFLLEGMDRAVTVMMAIFLSSLTTFLSFGLLAVGSTPLLASFGTSLFVGVLVAMISASIIVLPKRGGENG